MKNKYILLGITILSFFLYGNTLQNGYALDDTLVLTQNQFTKKGFSGLDDIFAYDSFVGFFGKEKNLVAGGRYRPLSLASLAVETEFFGLNPFISHFINIILYILTCYLLYLVLANMISTNDKKWYSSIPLLATFLFLIHPIHTEVVANIKGRDEMMTLLGALISMWVIIKYAEERKTHIKLLMLVLSGISFFLALLSKENAITFLAIIPAALYVFKRYSVGKIFKLMVPVILASAVFLIIRQKVLGVSISMPIDELLNDPFLHATISEKYATIMYTLGIYVKLLFFPHPLTYDYYPYHIEIVNWSNIVVLLSTLIYIVITIYAVVGTLKKETGGFAALLYIASLSIVSNLVFPIGTFMNERFVFISSIGFTIGLSLVLIFVINKLVKDEKARQISLYTFLFIVFTLSSIKVISRNTAWKDDLTLFTTDVKTSYNSAKSTCSAGGKLYETAKDMKDSVAKFKMLDQSVMYLHRAIDIHPTYTDALLLLGNALFEYKMYDSTIYYYKRITIRAPYFEKIYENLPIVLSRVKDPDFKIKTYEFFDSIKKNDYDINYQLGAIWGKEKGNIPKAISYLEKAFAINPARKEAMKDLGVAYGFSGRLDDALALFKKALKINPTDDQIYYNIGITLLNQGKKEEAEIYFKKAKDMAAK